MNTHIPPEKTPRRRLITIAALSVVVAIAGALGVGAPATAAAPATVVSFTFDDSNSDTVQASPILAAQGFHGTYYTNSGMIGQPDYQTRTDLSNLYAAGNEIAGHTVNHPDLATLPTTEAQREICLDRNNLLGWGFPVTDFAYPFADTNSTIDGLVQTCGYNSARNLGDVQTRFGCSGCEYAESIPPANAYELAAPDEVDSTWTLTDLENTVKNAQNNGGGWDILTFHHLCATACDPLAITPTLFSQFVSWLKTQTSNPLLNTSVKTVAGVIGGSVKPAASVPASTSSAAITNPSLETLDSSGNPTCWQDAGYGTNTATYSTTSDAHTGSVAGQISVTAYTDGDAKILPALDLGTCSPTATPGTTYALSEWYKSSAQTQFEIYLRTTGGAWVYWDASDFFPAASSYTQATFKTAAIPAGYNGISFGLALESVGTLKVDDFALTDANAVPVTTATANPAAPNGTNGWYTSSPTVTLSTPTTALATTTEYSTNNGTTWTPYTSAITMPNGTTTLLYRSKTNAQTEATKTATYKVDLDSPTISASFDNSTRTFTASATDATSGIASIQYRTPGGAWTTYTGPTHVGDGTVELEFRSTDNAGNVSASTSSISGPPITTATVVPGAPDGTAAWYVTTPKVTLSAGTPTADQLTQYSYNGTSWSTYVGPISIPDGTQTLYYRSTGAGFTEATHTLSFTVDTVDPTVTPLFDPSTRTYTATASDSGSGVATIEERVPGGTWTTYTGLTAVGDGGLSLEFRSVDNAGNVSDVVPLTAGAVTTATLSPANPDGTAGWYVTAPTITLTAGTPISGQVTQYSWDGTTWHTYSDPLTAPDGASTLSYRTTAAGHIETTQTLSVKVDLDAPTVSATFDAFTRTVTATAADTGSGVASIEWRTLGGTWTPYVSSIPVADTATTLEFRSTDAAGNVSAVRDLVIPIAPAATSSKITLTLTPSKVRYGSPANAVVSVVSGGAPAAGSVVLDVAGVKSYATVLLVNGTATIALPDNLKDGKHTVTAHFAGSRWNKKASAVSKSITVVKATPTVSFTLAPTPVIVKSTLPVVNVTVAIPGSSVVATGTIAVYVNGKDVKKVTLHAANNGAISVTLKAFSKKQNASIKVKFLGTSNLNAKTSATTKVAVTAV